MTEGITGVPGSGGVENSKFQSPGEITTALTKLQADIINYEKQGFSTTGIHHGDNPDSPQITLYNKIGQDILNILGSVSTENFVNLTTAYFYLHMGQSAQEGIPTTPPLCDYMMTVLNTPEGNNPLPTYGGAPIKYPYEAAGLASYAQGAANNDRDSEAVTTEFMQQFVTVIGGLQKYGITPKEKVDLSSVLENSVQAGSISSQLKDFLNSIAS